MKNTVTIREMLDSINPSPDVMPEEMKRYYAKNENGDYPYVIAAWRSAGEEAWHLGPYPAPFERVPVILEELGVKPAELRLVQDGLGIFHPEGIGYFYRAHAFMRGWNAGLRKTEWYAPFQQMPRFPEIEDAPQESIEIRLLSINYNELHLQFSMGEQTFSDHFDETLTNPLPLWAMLLKSLKENGYGHATVADDGFFYVLRVWSDPDGSAYIYFGSRCRRSDARHNVRWGARMSLKGVIALFENLFEHIFRHPDFISQYACYDCWRYNEEFTSRFQKAVEEAQLNAGIGPDDDPERDFELAWLRENVLTLEYARDALETYTALLRDLKIPKGWLAV